MLYGHVTFCGVVVLQTRMEKGGEEASKPSASLFAVTDGGQQSNPSNTNLEWLRNASFATDLSVIKAATTTATATATESDQPNDSDSDSDSNQQEPHVNPPSTSYQLLEEDGDDSHSNSDSDREGSKKRKKRRKKRKRLGDDPSSRKPNVRAWVDSSHKPAKDYYLDAHGDHDHFVYGSLYRMDVPRYKIYRPTTLFASDFQGPYGLKQKGIILDRDVDIDALDVKLKSTGRYWSVKYAALESHKNLKHLRLAVPKQPAVTDSDNFIPFSDAKISQEADYHGSVPRVSVLEESWEDEVLRKTREFNKSTREHPHDVKAWLDFAEFQDKVASMQPQRGARLQTFEKKISILEKAMELNPGNEELLLHLLKAYESRDSADVFIGKWEKALMHNSGSYKLWKEYLHVVQGEFSRFKVSDMRKLYGHAIQALSMACSKQFRQVSHDGDHCSRDPGIVQLELGLVDIFLSLCRLEWQAGYRELATALFQAEIEFSLFCPSLLLTEHSKLRLFEHFWNSDGPRVGEEGALGWSRWLEKEEENRQRIINELSLHDEEKGGWTGWSEPLSTLKVTDKNPENIVNNDVTLEDFQEEYENEDIQQEDNIEALLKQLGVSVDPGDSEVKDNSTWTRWSEEESLRDYNQWMPLHGKSDGISQSDGAADRDEGEQVFRFILFEDVSEYLFSIISEEARMSLISQFIEFFGGEMSQWICTNSSSWNEKFLGLEVLPDYILQSLRSVQDIVDKQQTSLSSNCLELLLGNSTGSSKRSDMMKFLRNIILLCLTVFPRNHKLEEAALVAEELSVMKMESSTPCRALAKSLLKRDRQDVLLCGVYAQREAAFSNIVHARKVFDMALSSAEGPPLDLQSNAPLLYFWYAEMELGNNAGYTEESLSRALHILSCFGNGAKYCPFERKPSSLQLLRAHQGFKERIRTVQLAWARGVIDDQSIAQICSAALFEELTTGWTAGIEVLDEAFKMVLPERRSHSYQLEFLYNYYVRMLLRHHKQSKVWESILQGLQIYPSSPELFKALVEISHLYGTPNKLRWIFDDCCRRKPSLTVWLFALSFEMSRGGSHHRIHGLFERAFADKRLRNSVVLWRMYISYEINIARNTSAARRIFFRAIHACPWSKLLWLDGFVRLNSILTAKELSDLQEVMQEKELNLRTDIYEILLQDELV